MGELLVKRVDLAVHCDYEFIDAPETIDFRQKLLRARRNRRVFKLSTTPNAVLLDISAFNDVDRPITQAPAAEYDLERRLFWASLLPGRFYSPSWEEFYYSASDEKLIQGIFTNMGWNHAKAFNLFVWGEFFGMCLEKYWGPVAKNALSVSDSHYFLRPSLSRSAIDIHADRPNDPQQPL